MRKYLSALLIIPAVLFGLATTADAHTGAPSFGPAACLNPGTGSWGAHLNITATDPALHPVAHIVTSASPFDVAIPSAGFSQLMTSTNADMEVTVYITWDDGYRVPPQGVYTATAHRPEGCVPGVDTTTPPPTDCAHANPPRDCGTTTVPPTTAPNPCITAPQPGQPGYDACGDCSTPEQCPVTTVPATTTTAAPPAVSVAKRQGPPRTAPPQTHLPATGAGGVLAMSAGAGALLIVGIALVLVLAWSARRRNQRPVWPHVQLEQSETRPEGYHRIRHQPRPGKS